jgi:cytochrome c556
MEANINKDRAKFNSLAKALHDAVLVALQAIDAKSPQGLIDAGEKMDNACENCHTTYWYPNQVLPPGYEQK